MEKVEHKGWIYLLTDSKCIFMCQQTLLILSAHYQWVFVNYWINFAAMIHYHYKCDHLLLVNWKFNCLFEHLYFNRLFIQHNRMYSYFDALSEFFQTFVLSKKFKTAYEMNYLWYTFFFTQKMELQFVMALICVHTIYSHKNSHLAVTIKLRIKSDGWEIYGFYFHLRITRCVYSCQSTNTLIRIE